jgi:uncharacterized membrane protein
MVRNICVFTITFSTSLFGAFSGVSIAIDVGMTIVATLAWFALSAFSGKSGVEAVNTQEGDHSATFTRV